MRFFYTASLVVSTRARVMDGLVRDRYAQQSEGALSTHTCQIVKTSSHAEAASHQSLGGAIGVLGTCSIGGRT